MTLQPGGRVAIALVGVLVVAVLAAPLHGALRPSPAAVVVVGVTALLVLGATFWTLLWWRQAQHLGPLELQTRPAGQHRARVAVTAGCAGLAALAALVALRSAGAPQLQVVTESCAACGWVVTLLLNLGSLWIGVQLRHDGVAIFGWACRWDCIGDYDWTGGDYATLVLYYRRPRLRRWRRGQRVSLDADEKGRVDAWLRHRLGSPRLERELAPPQSTSRRWTFWQH